jgi:hypothetical protein
MQDVTNPVSLPFYCTWDIPFLLDSMQYFFIFHTFSPTDVKTYSTKFHCFPPSPLSSFIVGEVVFGMHYLFVHITSQSHNLVYSVVDMRIFIIKLVFCHHSKIIIPVSLSLFIEFEVL